MNNIINTTDSTFEEEVLQHNGVALVDFWAPWCGPCKAMEPTFDEVVEEYADRVRFCKLNVDNNSELPAKYHVRGIPTLMLFINGALFATKVGALTKKQLTDFIDTALSNQE